MKTLEEFRKGYLRMNPEQREQVRKALEASLEYHAFEEYCQVFSGKPIESIKSRQAIAAFCLARLNVLEEVIEISAKTD